MRWDIFCRVIDNFGDIGVAWRLARQLAADGDAVRLFADDLSALAWMAPGGTGRVQALAWPGPADPVQPAEVADGVIEAFGCDPPPAYVAAMRERATAPPVWINLEYLSAEHYVERSHGLPSPRADGLRKWFFYPGFTARTGGLLRESGLVPERAAFRREAWFAAQGIARQPHERVVSLFCYANAALPAFVASLATAPTVLLLTPGPAQQQLRRLAEQGALGPLLRTHELPWLDQREFDHLLWASDLNAVRGEDSLVRALWAGAPCLWQAYPQDDAAHLGKLRAWLDWLAAPAEVRAACLAFNSAAPWPGLPPFAPWQGAVSAARERLLAQPDLVTQLRGFVAMARSSAAP